MTRSALGSSYEEGGIEGLASFGHEGRTCRLNEQQRDKLNAEIAETLPRTTRKVGAPLWVKTEFCIEYQGGLV